jgi:excisionase family DNA binding protein
VETGNGCTAKGMGTASEWLTAEEAMAYLRLPSRDALYQAVSRGQLPVHRMGRRLRFRRAELDARLRAA